MDSEDRELEVNNCLEALFTGFNIEWTFGEINGAETLTLDNSMFYTKYLSVNTIICLATNYLLRSLNN